MKNNTITELENAKSALKIRGNQLSEQKIEKIIKAIEQAIIELQGQ